MSYPPSILSKQFVYCRCKMVRYDTAIGSAACCLEPLSWKVLCMCSCVLAGEEALAGAATFHTGGANGPSAPAPLGPCSTFTVPRCLLHTNTSNIQRQVTTSSPSHLSSFFSSHATHIPFIPDALTLNYFHTKFVCSLRKPLELAR